jgi:hypothetical protein
MLKRTFKISKAIHKYLGLVLVLYLMWMSLTGILLNHPQLISGISVPQFLVPKSYHIKDWHRGALKSVIYADSTTAFAFGKQGIFKTNDSGKSFHYFMKGEFPVSAYNRKTSDLFLNNEKLIASTKKGFYISDINNGNWVKLATLAKVYDAIKVVKTNKYLIAVSSSNIYRAIDNGEYQFKLLETSRTEKSNSISLIEFFFMLHDGTIWGFPGKLLWDGFALILFFLSLSAIYIWFLPKKWKRKKNNGKPRKLKERKLFKFFYKYHLKLGIWVVTFLIIIVGTGMFIHPPLIVAIMGGSIPKQYVPTVIGNNPWKKKIRNILYDKARNKLLIDADGLWEVDDEMTTSFTRSPIRAQIFAMGATVFESANDSSLLIGSFGGLHKFETVNSEAKNILPIDPNAKKSRSGLGQFMVTGYFETPQGEKFFNTHRKGLLNIDGTKNTKKFLMPSFIVEDYRMSLWNYAFEIHNGRMFKSLVGFFYLFVNPLLGLLTIIMLLTGVFDWLYRKIKS